MDNSFTLCSLLIEITQKCNALCDQCGSRCDPHGEEALTKENILSALRDIKENIGTSVMINITGGEPLMRRDFFELTKEITELGFDWGMVTNGSLITETAVKKLKESGMKTITVSLDGLRETHDSLRHLPGCFDKIISALKMLKQEAFTDHLQVTFTANRRNVFEFAELYKILNEIKIDSVRVGLMDPIGRGADNRGLLLTREEIIYFTQLTNKLNSVRGNIPIIWGCPHYFGKLIPGRKFRCFAGKQTASILYNGDIYVCPNVGDREKYVQGNILKDSFSEVWKNGFRFFREKQLPEGCADCEYREDCKGDSVHTMDFTDGKPMFCYRDYIVNPSPEDYKKNLFGRYPEMKFAAIPPLCDSGDEIIIEPEAFGFIKDYFHIGKKSPVSMYEQQMALFGFSCGDLTVIRYAVPCDGTLRGEDNALFTGRIMRTVDDELSIINKNYFLSSDRDLCGCADDGQPMKFVGFIHSHPVQAELQYSEGDEKIHRRMIKKFGSYCGILVNPALGTMGAYSGKDILQTKLIIPVIQ